MKKHFHIILLLLIFSKSNSKNLDHKKIDFSKQEIDYLKNAKEDVAYVSTDVKHQIKKLCKKGIINKPQKELQEFCQSCNNNWKVVPMRVANAAIAQTKSLLNASKDKLEAKKYNKVESILNRYHKNLETKKAQFFFKANDKAVDASGAQFFNDLVVRDVLRVENLFRTTKPNGQLGFRAGHDNHVGQAVVSRIPVRVNFQPTNPDAPFALSVVGTTSLRSLVVNQDTTIKGTLNVNTNIFVGGSAVVLDGANVGNGTGLIFQSKSDNTLNFRSLVAGTNIDFDTTSNNNQITISAIGDGTGDVVGPAGATNNAIAKFNGNSGKTIQNSAVIIDSSNNISTPGQITAAQFNGPLNGNATSSTSFTGPLSGDVTGTQNATVVSFVGGQSAANVAAGTVLANNATSANTANAIVRRDASGNFSAGIITANLNGNSTGFTGSLSGDVTGTQGATVVSLVGGKTAAQVSTSVDDTLAATSANTPNTLVKRDGSGNFSAGTITANLNGNSTGFTGSLSGDVTGTQSATVVSLVGGKTAAQVSTSVDDTLAATSANTPNTLVKRDGSGNFSAGTVTAATGFTATTGNVTISSGNLALTNSTSSTTGNITKAGSTFIHNFGSDNTFVGIGSGNFTTTGARNTALGFTTLTALTSGNFNTAIGTNALDLCTTGALNVAVGTGALTSLTTGAQNTAIGINAGSNLNSNEQDNIYISNDGVAAESNTIRIGGATGTGPFQQNRCFIAGIVGNNVAGNPVEINAAGQLGDFGASSKRYKRDIKDMNEQSADIMRLRPVSFKYNQDIDKSESKQFGLVAEEVEQVMPELVGYKDDQPQSVRYHKLPVLLLNELQRLRKEHSLEINKLNNQIKEQNEKIAQQKNEYKEQIAQLMKMIAQEN